MTEKELNGIWNYYLSLEKDMDNTSRYVEPEGQENVHSFEFAKILILACTEAETVFKAICTEIDRDSGQGNIGGYKAIILGKYPQIVNAEVNVTRLGKTLKPFEEWQHGKLKWWDAYTDVKHNRGEHFESASYLNAVSALSALYILIFYLSRITGIGFKEEKSQYIDSEYCIGCLLVRSGKALPGFESNE